MQNLKQFFNLIKHNIKLAILVVLLPILILTITQIYWIYNHQQSNEAFFRISLAIIIGLISGFAIFIIKLDFLNIRRKIRKIIKNEKFIYIYSLPILFIIVFTVINKEQFDKFNLNVSDYPLIEIQIQLAKTFDAELGQYSKYKFFHPGPISFYYYAAIEKIVFFIKSDMGKHLYSQFILNIIFLIIAMNLVYSSFRRKYYSLLLFFSVLFVLEIHPEYFSTWYSYWAPCIIIFPMLTLILSGSKIAYGNIRYILIYAISATFIIQNHLGGLGIVFVFTIYCLFLYIRNYKKERITITKIDYRYLIFSLLFLIIAFFPVIYEQFSSEKGNILKILQFYTNPSSSNSFYDALDYTLNWYLLPINKFLTLNTDSFYIIFSILFLIILLSIKRYKTQYNYIVYCFSVVLLSSLFSANMIRGNYQENHHALYFEYAAVIIFYFILFKLLIDLIYSLINSTNKYFYKRYTLVLPLILVLFIISFGKYYKLKSPVEEPIVNDFSLVFEKNFEISKNVTYQIHDYIGWNYLSGIINRLLHDEYQICVNDDLLFQYGKIFSCDEKENIVDIIIIDKSKSFNPVTKELVVNDKYSILYGNLNDSYINGYKKELEETINNLPNNSILVTEMPEFRKLMNIKIKNDKNIKILFKHLNKESLNKIEENEFFIQNQYLENIEKRKHNINQFKIFTFKDIFEKYKDNIIIISGLDGAQAAIDENTIKYFKSMGSKLDILLYRGSYASIIYNNKFMFEYINNDSKVVIDNNNMNDETKALFTNSIVSIVSSGYKSGDISSIKINNKEYSLNKRGMNIAIFDTKLNHVYSTFFDTHETVDSYDSLYKITKK